MILRDLMFPIWQYKRLYIPVPAAPVDNEIIRFPDDGDLKKNFVIAIQAITSADINSLVIDGRAVAMYTPDEYTRLQLNLARAGKNGQPDNFYLQDYPPEILSNAATGGRMRSTRYRVHPGASYLRPINAGALAAGFAVFDFYLIPPEKMNVYFSAWRERQIQELAKGGCNSYVK